MSDIMQIPLDKLIESPFNVRTAPCSEQADKELLASIGAIGLQSALIVTANITGEYEVVAGGRRVKALRALAGNDDCESIVSGTLVPCIIKNVAEDNISEISLIENTHRAALHPADEFDRYYELNQSGMPSEEIANHFGVTHKHVWQRLKMASVHPDIITDYRQGECNLETIMLFTIEENQDRQLAVWQGAKNENLTESWDIQRTLKETKLSSNDSLVKFVTLDAYKENGGAVTTDLFDDNTYANDPDLIRDLAMEKLSQHAEQLKEQGWKWVDISLKEPHEMINRCRIISSEPANQPDELNKKLDTVEKRIDEIYDIDEDGASEEENKKLNEELETLETQQQELQDEVDLYMADNAIWSASEITLAGCAVYVSGSSIETTYGLVKKEDLKALQALRQNSTTESAETTGQPAASTAEQAEDDNPELSHALRVDLARHRLHITQSALAKNATLARDALYYSLCTSILGQESDRHFHADTPINIQTQANISISDIDRLDLNNSKAGKEIKTLRESLSTDWFSANSNVEMFQQFQALSSAKKQSLMAYCTAKILHGDIASMNAEIEEHITESLNIAWHKYFRPTKENYLSRTNKETLTSIGKPFLDDWETDTKNYKKAQLAEQLEDVFAGKDERLTKDARKKALEWVPAAFAK